MNKSVLEELIININNRTGIRNEILEKDYYVCLVLKSLSIKQKDLQAYFKGGTAIYKVLNHMNRFSEDIDLTVKVNEDESKNSNRMRLKRSALDYHLDGLQLNSDETVDKKGSITAFYQYDSLFYSNELFRSGKIQIEATSFTVSEPVAIYTIQPLIYQYATEEEKIILRNTYKISEFEIAMIKLERIFVDKIFAAEFYYERKMYYDVSKHLYDIVILMNQEKIQTLLKSPSELKLLIQYKRKEELARIGGIDEHKSITDFEYMKMEFDDEFIQIFDRMQQIYVLDEYSKITIHDVVEKLQCLWLSLKTIC